MSTLKILRNATARRLMKARKRMQRHDSISVFEAGGWAETAHASARETNDLKTQRQYEAIRYALFRAAAKQGRP